MLQVQLYGLHGKSILLISTQYIDNGDWSVLDDDSIELWEYFDIIFSTVFVDGLVLELALTQHIGRSDWLSSVDVSLNFISILSRHFFIVGQLFAPSGRFSYPKLLIEINKIINAEIKTN